MLFLNRTLILLALTVLALSACRTQRASADLAAKVQAFDEYPILWLGETYDADGDGVPDPIRTARSSVSPAFYSPRTGELMHPELRWFTISYGTCKIPAGATACPIPLQLDFSAPCETYPLSEIAKKGTMKVRGVDAIVGVNGNLRFETADFTLTIGTVAATDEEITQKALRVANDLIPANAKARAGLTGTSFRAKPANLCANTDIGGTATSSASPTSTPTPAATPTAIAVP